jgi:predicted site-specific integrase-resolvase
MKVSDFAKKLGVDLSTVYKWIKRGLIQSEIKSGKFAESRISINTSKKNLIKFIQNQKHDLKEIEKNTKMRQNKLNEFEKEIISQN